MSKTSAKQRYEQLMEWRSAMNINVGKRKKSRGGQQGLSRMEYMSKQGR